MKEFLADLEAIFWDIWNALYAYLCEIMDGEVNEDWLAPLDK